MGKSVNIVLIKQKPLDKEGTLYIRTIEDRTPKKKSLGIKVKETDWEKYFNTKTQRFKADKRFILSEQLNTLISSKLSELNKHDNDLAYLPNEKKSFTKYWERYIETIENYGTKIKHEVVYAKLKKFLEAKNKTGLLFVEMTPQMLRDLKFYFTKTKDPKTLSANTVNHYLKIIKSIINKASIDDYFEFPKNPFATFTFKKDPIIKGVLSASELSTILSRLFWEDYLNGIRDMFIFQLFANGMRVSDLLLLRWNNFDTGRLNYKMYKTTYPISIPVNLNLAKILHDVLGTTETYSKQFEIFKQNVFNEQGEWERLSLAEIEAKIDRVGKSELVLHKAEKEKFNKNVEKHNLIKYKGYYFTKADESTITRLIDAKEQLIKQVDDVYIITVFSKIREFKGDALSDFVFPILDNEAFKNIDGKNDFSKLSLEQYKKLKHATIVYNRKLKKLQTACGVSTTLTSHVARHSYTNLMLTMKDVNLYDLSQSLGHASISITQNYISSGFNLDKLDEINKVLSQQFRRK